MTAPLPHEKASSAPRRLSAKKAARRRATLTRKWAYLISTTAYLPHTHAEIERHLTGLLDQLFEALRADSFDPTRAARAGTTLVELRCVGPDSLQCTLEVLGKGLLAEPELRGVDRLPERVVLLLGALASGYTEALREVTQKQQEDLNRTLLTVERETHRQRLIAQAQFEEVFTGSASGIAITDLDGRVLRASPALAETLDRPAAELVDTSLFDLLHAEDADGLKAAFRDVVEGKARRLRMARKLVARGGETLWANVSGSVVLDAAGEPARFVLVVDDDTDVSLLQRRLNHQALHDGLTGLPNRQFFSTRLERALRHVNPDTGLTVYHLDLDGFSLIADGLGHERADRMLKKVAGKLGSVVEGEDAVVARLGGDEFGILVESTPTTPDVDTMVRRINEELSEPVYLDGEHFVGVSASIGVVHRPPRDVSPAELLRAADLTLRRARGNGYRQWQLFDPELDARDRDAFSLAAVMPGAWENGEVEVVYRALVRLRDNAIVGMEALLQWDHPRRGVLPHETCVKLAAATGLIMPLGNWLLATACDQVVESGGGVPVVVALTAYQAGDPDLVGTIRRTLDDTGLPPERLRPGFPVATLLGDREDAVENIKVLAEIGVASEIHDFGAAGDVECFVDLPVRTVRVARRLADSRPERTGSLVARSLQGLTEIAHLAGTTVVVDGLQTTEQAAWWRQVGADVGTGPFFTTTPRGLTRPSEARRTDPPDTP